MNRSLQIDAMKGLGILLVVLGHVVQWNTARFDDNIVFRMIYSFHMPLFMFLSGYVVKPADPALIRKNILRLVVPFFGWYMVAYAQLLMTNANAPGFVPYMMQLALHPDNGLWFLWVLFLCHVTLRVFYVLHKNVGLAAALAAYVLIYISPVNGLGFSMWRWQFVFYFAGFTIAQIRPMLTFVRYPAMLLGALGFGLLFPCWYRTDHDMLSAVLRGLVGREVTSWTVYQMLNYATAFCGIITAYTFVHYGRKLRGVEKTLTFFGKYTLEIYTTHYQFLGLAFGAEVVRIIGAFVTALTGALGLSWVLKKIPVVQTALYGVPPRNAAKLQSLWHQSGFGRFVSRLNIV